MASSDDLSARTSPFTALFKARGTTIDFYDQAGDAIAYSDDGEHIYLFTGKPVAYLDSDAVYSNDGDQRGWFADGWIRDKGGRCVAFSNRAVEGPFRPPMHAKPEKGVRQPRPLKATQDPRTLHPIYSNAWSEQSATEFCRGVISPKCRCGESREVPRRPG